MSLQLPSIELLQPTLPLASANYYLLGFKSLLTRPQLCLFLPLCFVLLFMKGKERASPGKGRERKDTKKDRYGVSLNGWLVPIHGV